MLESILTIAHEQFVIDDEIIGNGVTDRKSREKWEQEGSLDARQRALVIAGKLLANPKPTYIPKEIDKAIREKFSTPFRPLRPKPSLR